MNIKEIEDNFRPTDDGKCAIADNGMVTTAFPDATRAGVKILQAGGNAIDAACSAALALGVCEPQASGVGGQTMMLIYNGKKVIAIDGSSRAPSLAHVNAMYKFDRVSGYRATTVPSTLATIGYVQKKFGILPWYKIVEPAIQIAVEGYAITKLQHDLQLREITKFNTVESKSGIKYFYKNGFPYKTGDTFIQPDLAKMLAKIAQNGVEEFYTGSIAKIIDADMREHGGLLRKDDLALIPWPIERQPLRGKFRKMNIFTMPPPGSGRTLLFALSMLNAIQPNKLSKNRQMLILAEIFRKAFLERSDRPFDPNFYPQVADKEMLSSRHAQQCIKAIAKMVAPGLPIRETEDELSGETTHLSVIDKDGSGVSLTQSIERVYGSKAACESFGFLYNNYILDFEFDIPGHPFYLRPNSVPWATVAPTLIFNKKKLWMALGSPGSERIISTITQFLLHMFDKGMSMKEAMIEPRLHCSLGGRISLEADRFSQDIVSSLTEHGYRISKKDPYSFYLGAIHAVLKCHDNSGFQGVAEIRRDGIAAGY
ncbi:MAG: gamma-glutamyltransferase family protein [Chitinispirillia bacterium]|jgi:gamma-glutamyltranspeptidase/glutathione hydrolase